MALTLIIGVALIVYSRSTLPSADDSPPTLEDHWHEAYGFYMCDSWYSLSGTLGDVDENGVYSNSTFRQTGVHSHDDGAIHWHPYSPASTGDNATLGVFLDGYDVELDDDKIVFPEDNALGGQTVWEEGETKCGDQDAEVSVVVWENYADTGDGRLYISKMDEIPVDRDGMVFSIYFAPEDTEQVMPPWAADLPTLAENDALQPTEENLGSSSFDISMTLPPSEPTSDSESTTPADSTATTSTPTETTDD